MQNENSLSGEYITVDQENILGQRGKMKLGVIIEVDVLGVNFLKAEYIQHDSHDTFYRDPFGALPCSSKVTLKLKVEGRAENNNDIPEVYLVLKEESQGVITTQNIQMRAQEYDPECIVFTAGIITPSSPCLLWYYFLVEFNEGQTCYYGNNEECSGGLGMVCPVEPLCYQITVYDENYSTPSWWKDAVVYQIFVDRFKNGLESGQVLNPKKNSLIHSHWDNVPVYIRELTAGRVVRWDFFGGNLYGVRKKLHYLQKLGISAVYFNPLFESPSNHKYDVSDYHKIDPMFGDNDFFSSLCFKAEKLGIYFILDGVFSHTGSDSIYFNKLGSYSSLGAYQSTQSPYFSWYIFKDYPHSYECWWGIETLPNVRELDPSYQDFIIYGENSVIKHWKKMGAKGWRLDVADELPGEFLKNLRGELKKLDPDSVIIGEVWEDASIKVSYEERREYFQGKELDGVMGYPMRNSLVDFILGKTDASCLHASLMSLYENYPKESFYSSLSLLGTHDIPRILSVLGAGLREDTPEGKKKTDQVKRLKLASLFQMTFPGVPCIYYGDEAGLEGGEDPYNRGTFPWGNEDLEILSWYYQIVALRNHYDVLRTGDWFTLYARGVVYAFARVIEGGTDSFGELRKDNVAVVLLNREMDEKTVSLDLKGWGCEKMVDPLKDYEELIFPGERLELTLNPLEGKVLLKDRWGSNMKEERKSGVLLHPTSLPSEFGVGDMGGGAYEFVDFLAQSSQKLWQVLPLNPPAVGYSPYQCLSAFAGNPLLIDPWALYEEGLIESLKGKSLPHFPEHKAEYVQAEKLKEELFREAFENFKELPPSSAYEDFLQEHHSWLEDYALFMALKKYYGGKAWNEWDEGAAFRDPETLKYFQDILKEEIEYHKFLQFKFFKQWSELKKYANDKGIEIIGDLPIFVAHDSSDVWSQPHLFEVDEKGNPLKVAGVPPDYFSSTGQMWGNPHYHWDEMENRGYHWWKERFRILTKLVDIIRVDHFRGFEAYWEVPAHEETAVNGRWVKGPGEKFFEKVKEDLGDISIIAEDLGYITPEVEELRVNLGFPGMEVMQFALDEVDSNYKLPLCRKNTVVYTGTHDNDTLLGWLKDRGYNFAGQTEEEACWKYIEIILRSDAQTVIIPMQDILALDSDRRMNIPGTVENNWRWRLSRRQLNKEVAAKLKELTQKYRRN